ncbi:hypothetical protein FB45DRAFT_1030245 [Roridomyces roridus]|uniref:Uncharacterized protein n=1 Tax=Roridomyces roridus TaxID=1738132 RepID=A0AAD7FL13_9AGAR|nr:hypothetical protein FB45DRAFT_1030245 [Roridomyces roridus]
MPALAYVPSKAISSTAGDVIAATVEWAGSDTPEPTAPLVQFVQGPLETVPHNGPSHPDWLTFHQLLSVFLIFGGLALGIGLRPTDPEMLTAATLERPFITIPQRALSDQGPHYPSAYATRNDVIKGHRIG